MMHFSFTITLALHVLTAKYIIHLFTHEYKKNNTINTYTILYSSQPSLNPCSFKAVFIAELVR